MALGGQAELGGGALALELHLAVTPEQMPRLRRHPLFAAARPTRRRVAATYFDTPDLALHRRSLTLRVGKEGRRYVQTLTGANGELSIPPALVAWRTPVPSPAPDLSRLGAPEQLAEIDTSRLQPVFVSHRRRSTRTIHPGPATTVAVSCDEGQVETTAGHAFPVCELGLRLEAGAPEALYELARGLNETTALRIETRSEAERAYRLLPRDGVLEPVDAGFGTVELRRDLAAEDAFAAILRHALWHMLANDQAALGGDVEGVHQMRVALRRLRATFSLFRPMISDDHRVRANTELKWIASTLGAARNWDVLGEYLLPLARHFAADDGITALSRAIGESRRGAYAAVTQTITAPRYTDFVLRMLTWTESRGWRQQSVSEASVLLLAPIGDLAADLLDQCHHKARKLAKQFEYLAPDGRHKLRIAVKKLRYAIDSLQHLYRTKPVTRRLKRLGALQDDLGVINDITTMDGLLDELQATAASEELGRGSALLRGWYGRVMIERQGRLGDKIDRFLDMKPFWRETAA
jgi:triphosphatase